jgi:hypothetical protein
MCGEPEEEEASDEITLQDVVRAWGRTRREFVADKLTEQNDQGKIKILNGDGKAIVSVLPHEDGNGVNADALILMMKYVHQEWKNQ